MHALTVLFTLLLAAPLALAEPVTLTPRQIKLLPPGVSSDGKCGKNSVGGNVTCVGSPFGNCCSNGGFCGKGTAYCGEGLCAGGDCVKPPVPGAVYTKDGTCGADKGGTFCGDLWWGPCCSTSGYCGRDEAHCNTGFCQSGACKGTAPVSGGPSLDGHCGPNFPGNQTCDGTTFGTCCSSYGFCGAGVEYCAKDVCHSGKCLLV